MRFTRRSNFDTHDIYTAPKTEATTTTTTATTTTTTSATPEPTSQPTSYPTTAQPTSKVRHLSSQQISFPLYNFLTTTFLSFSLPPLQQLEVLLLFQHQVLLLG